MDKEIKDVASDGRCPWCRGKMIDTFGATAEDKKNGDKIYKGFSLVIPQEDKSMVVLHASCKHYVNFPDGINIDGERYVIEKYPNVESQD